MTPERMRIKIAQKLGWKILMDRDDVVRPLMALRPDDEKRYHIVPDFAQDLNACAEFEKMLDVNIQSGDSLRYTYSRYLYSIVPDPQQPFRATAMQRCEAFLRTFDLWEE